MPKISEFDGIKIYIYWNDSEHHHLPHFHAEYNRHKASYELNGEMIIGNMPRNKNILIREWALERFRELDYAWQCARELKELPWISPC
jgi:hypothetical protein